MTDLLKAIRWLNVLMIALAQILLLNKYNAFSSYNWTVIMLTAMVVILGNIDNNIEDYHLDINAKGKSKNSTIEWLIKHKYFRYFEASFIILCIIVGILKSVYLMLAIPTYLALKLYNSKLKKLPFIGNIVIAILCSASLFALSLPCDFIFMQIASLILLLTLLRELAKDKEDEKADSSYNYKTLAIIMPTNGFVMICLALLLLIGYVAFMYLYSQPYLLSIGILICIAIAWFLLKLDWKSASLSIKLLILLGILSIGL